MRVIIRCAGQATRWKNHLDVPKHLVELCGEPVLERTVRLISEIRPAADIKVVVKDLSDRRYLIPPSSRTIDKPNPTNGDLDKIASTAHLWDSTDRTVLLWGDTWWSRKALTDVLTNEHPDWHVWLRFGPNNRGGELFAFTWPAAANDKVHAALDRALQAHHAGLLAHAGYNKRPVRGGWAMYRSLTGANWDDHRPRGHHTTVDDWTEDMDTPDDWHRWCARYARASRRRRKEMTR